MQPAPVIKDLRVTAKIGHLAVKGSRGSYAVYDGETKVSKDYTCEYAAAGKATRLEKDAMLRTRPCLCCGTEMKSTGPHHRLCDPCRQRG